MSMHIVDRTRVFVAVVLVLTLSSSGQTRQDLAFEAASVRPNNTLGGGIQIRPERLDITAYPLRGIITLAYGVEGTRLEGAPAWTGTERFDIRAIPPRPVERGEMLLMLRTLLAERFALKVHEETRSMETYVLVLANAERGPGPGLHPVNVDCDTNRLADDSKPGLFPPEARPPCGRAVVSTTVASGPVLTKSKRAAVTMAEFAGGLWGAFGRPVFDKTGLTGRFDVEWQYVREIPPNPFIDPVRRPAEGPSQRAALTEQLGLRLESDRGDVEMLVIDAVERPRPEQN